MTIWAIKHSERLVPGQAFTYSYEYAKRAECFPPRGRGQVDYLLWMGNDAGVFVNFRPIQSVDSVSQPASHAYRTETVPVPNLIAGHYAIQYRKAFVCEGSSATQYLDGPLMEFEVVALRS
jgi:hypothetical protein